MVGKEGSGVLKLVRIMLETQNLVRKYTHTYVISKNLSFGTKTLIILIVSAFFGKNSNFAQSYSKRAVSETF